MASGKKSFILYADQITLVSSLTDDEAGRLFKHILAYVNDLDPECSDRIVQVAFEPIKQQLKRDLKYWEDKRVRRQEAGKLGAEAKWQKIAKDGNAINSMAKMAVNVNGNVNVNDNVILFSIEECSQIALRDDRWVRANKTNEKELTKFNEYLEKLGSYKYNPLDYKRYFAKIKGKYPDLVKTVLSADDFRKAMQITEKQ